ncbi:MAG: Aminopeptidase P domain protein [candidate division TM6 bacterium GW2011_GWF2_38_10]|nr:MAG: Aminopeptidase P domain protein [candidate division TM6 bacterium GW2011_GWF2_38_10]
MMFKPLSDFTLFADRRDRLLSVLDDVYGFEGPALFLTLADFEGLRTSFRQDSTFYYFTGITEPAAIGCFYLQGHSTLYIPKFWEQRAMWVTSTIGMSSDPGHYGFNEIRALGNAEKSYCFKPLLLEAQYYSFIADITSFIKAGGRIFACVPTHGFGALLFERLATWISGFSNALVDVSRDVARLRREKDAYELQLIHAAAQITALAHEQVAGFIKPGVFEYQVRGLVDYVFASTAAAVPAFPSIVASGYNATILHYTDCSQQLQSGDLVVIDCGAEYGNYAADVSRTYPANGSFTPRQRSLYEIVLEVQEYIASIARPGMFLCNKEYPDISLHHQALACFKQYDLDRYFCHGLGHFLGLDVHDVGDVQEPLSPGDVFTLEPGVYLPHESCGIRIEDDYVMADDGAVCLSDALVKKPDDIEALMTRSL